MPEPYELETLERFPKRALFGGPLRQRYWDPNLNRWVFDTSTRRGGARFFDLNTNRWTNDPYYTGLLYYMPEIGWVKPRYAGGRIQGRRFDRI